MSENSVTLSSSDKPAIVDKLGTEEQQKGLIEFMRHCSTPMTIAVQGNWGTGKTSMMQLLKAELEKENGSTLWFPTWQFAVLGEQDRLLMDLLMLLCCKLEENCSKMKKEDKAVFNKVTRFIKRVGRASAIGSFYLAAETGKKLSGIGFTNVLDKLIGKLEKQDKDEKNYNVNETNITYESYVMQVSELHQDLTKLVDVYLGENKTKRLYIFIDDLDRLEPVRAVELLEGIKNFLDIPRCVFMLAIDTKVVKEGLKEKYGENMDEDKLVHFFDKIIQIPYKLPVHNYKLKAFMEDVLEGYDKENADKYVEFLESADIRNPRTIKRCVNFCLLHHYMDGEDAVSVKDKNVKLHRFAIKMLELEREDLYWLLLGKVRASGENYLDKRNAILELEQKLLTECANSPIDIMKKKYKLYYKVLQSFDIDENADEKCIETFSDYIIRSAPADIVDYKCIEAAQDIYRFINLLKQNGVGLNKIYALSGENEEIFDITKIPEIARMIEKKRKISCYFEFRYGTIKVYFNLNGIDNIIVESDLLKEYLIKDYCVYYENQSSSQEDIIVYKRIDYEYEFWNIKDISSPDAPIYKILQAAGVIKIPTELTPAAP